MASPANQHCANCIGTLSFPIGMKYRSITSHTVGAVLPSVKCCGCIHNLRFVVYHHHQHYFFNTRTLADKTQLYSMYTHTHLTALFLGLPR